MPGIEMKAETEKQEELRYAAEVALNDYVREVQQSLPATHRVTGVAVLVHRTLSGGAHCIIGSLLTEPEDQLSRPEF